MFTRHRRTHPQKYQDPNPLTNSTTNPLEEVLMRSLNPKRKSTLVDPANSRTSRARLKYSCKEMKLTETSRKKLNVDLSK